MRSQRGLPWGIALFLGYAGLILVGIGLSLPAVIDMAIDAPVSLVGVVVMVLLAYTIFTVTLVLQRKAAAKGLAMGLVSLTIPALLFALLAGLLVPALFLGTLAALLLRGLTRAPATAWLDQP